MGPQDGAEQGGFKMPWTAAAAGISGVAGIFGAKKQSDAMKYSAQLQSASARRAGDLQAQSAANQLAYAKEQSKQLRADTEFARKANYGIWGAETGNEADRFNIGNRLDVDRFNTGAANARNQFSAMRNDANARYSARSGDMSNLRAMLGGNSYATPTFEELQALERMKDQEYTPNTPAFMDNPNASPAGSMASAAEGRGRSDTAQNRAARDREASINAAFRGVG
tara:strand:- start:593 stop:1267 length:675 start_codon:yes stop_codon:yes gene_type:complete